MWTPLTFVVPITNGYVQFQIFCWTSRLRYIFTYMDRGISNTTKQKRAKCMNTSIGSSHTSMRTQYLVGLVKPYAGICVDILLET